MSSCDQLTANAAGGVAPALRAVDCLANEATTSAFGRLFGGNGALMPALTILLTLYIAFFALSLLTGRSRIGISALTPRMMTLGLVLTFATSWIAYQSVVWNLAVGAPDQIAGILTGAKGSATEIFGNKIDVVFAAIADAADAGRAAAQSGATAPTPGSFQPADLMWLGAIILLLGTVGVLLTARIALAVLLALGPVFVVLALFPGTRGLFAGWLRGVVLTATAPLFVVVGGGLSLELMVPVVAALHSADGAGIDARGALALFMIAAVHMALMIMLMRVCSTMVGSWSVFGLSGNATSDTPSPAHINDSLTAQPAVHTPDSSVTGAATRRVALISPIRAETVERVNHVGGGQAASRPATINLAGLSLQAPAPLRAAAAHGRGIGSRFRAAPANRIREYAR